MKMKSLTGCLILLSLVFFVFSAEVYPITVHDFRVNSDSSEGIAQFVSKIAFDKNGNFTIVWSDRGVDHNNRQIYFQRFDSSGNRLGNPVLISDTTIRYNNSPCIAMAPSRSFVICWSTIIISGQEYIYDVWAQGFNSLGQPAWPRQQVDIDRPAGPRDRDYHSSIAVDKEGNFIVVWQTQDSTGRNVFAQRFDPSGERIGNNFLVSDLNATNYQVCDWLTQYPDVAFNSEGYFFICWHGCIQCKPLSPGAPLARIYNPAGEPKTLVFPFFDPCSSKWAYGNDVTVASNSQNNFVVTFSVNDTFYTYPNNAVIVQTFDTLGNPLDSGRIVNDVIDLGNVWFYPHIAVDSVDGYIVLWSDERTITDRNLWAQRFNSSGEPQGANYRINIPPGSLVSPDGHYNWDHYDLAISGNTVGIAWLDFRNYMVYDADIYAKLLDLDVIGYYLPGDVVLDGKVDLTDVIYLCHYLLKSGWGILPLWPADVNADTSINLGDVIYLANYLFKGGPSPQHGKL